MRKRILVIGLWTFAFWYLGSMISALLGAADVIGPVLGVAVGAFVWTDPRGLFWPRPVVLEEPKAVQPLREDRLAA